jgi:hypothetical protein
MVKKGKKMVDKSTKISILKTGRDEGEATAQVRELLYLIQHYHRMLIAFFEAEQRSLWLPIKKKLKKCVEELDDLLALPYFDKRIVRG